MGGEKMFSVAAEAAGKGSLLGLAPRPALFVQIYTN